jgi:hypothetical protein
MFNNEFSSEEETAILEIARRALSDGDIFDEMADELDMTDDDLKLLQRKILRATDD